MNKTSQKKSHLPNLIVSVVGEEIPNYTKQNKALSSLLKVVEHKLDKALKESEKDTFTDWETRQTFLMGYRKAMREILSLKPIK